MHRVELKVVEKWAIEKGVEVFLMHRVELKASCGEPC